MDSRERRRGEPAGLPLVDGLFAYGAFALIATFLQIAGFASLAILDRVAAPNDDGPLPVERLRPLQICVPIAVLAAVAIWIWRSPFL